MATVYETEVGLNAPDNINTGHSISVGDEFFGRLRAGGEDWILVNLLAGRTYVIDLAGDNRDDPDRPGPSIGALPDPVLRIYDDKGDLLAINDDISGATGDLRSRLNFQPTEDGVYFLSAGAFASAGNEGDYRLSLRETRIEIQSGANADTKLVGSGAAEALLGLGGNDILEGRGGDDVLRGRGGDDVLIGGAGADVLRGGGDNIGDENVPVEDQIGDTASYQGSPEGVTVSLEDGEATGGHAQDDDIGTDIENLRGSDNADDLTGNGRNNRLYGDGGNDELNGRGGDDVLSGGAGDDDLDGGDDDDILEGGPGADSLEGGDDDDTASYAGSRAPVDVRLHDGGIFRGGDAEGDTFFRVVDGLADIEHLTGSGGADTLAGDSRDNTINGGPGDDVLYGGPGAAEGRVTNADRLYGGEGNDQLFGGPGADTLDGGNGDDVLSGGSGADSYVGGDGNDLIYADYADSVALDVDGGDGSRDTLTFERVTRTLAEQRDEGAISVDLSGDGITSIEILIGSRENDRLTGSSGPETIEGGEGGDTLDGGGGTDILSYASSEGPVDVNLETGNASGGDARGDTINNFENLRGSDFGDFLAGQDDAPNVIEGGPGADLLDGGAEWTSRTVNADRDRTDDNADPGDWLSYASSTAGVVVDLDSGNNNINRPSASGGDAEGDNIAPGTFENIMGGSGNDQLTGDEGHNVLHGGPGADRLDGGFLRLTGTDPDTQDTDTASYKYAAPTGMAPAPDGMGMRSIGVTVDLVDFDESTGDAEGDRYFNIETYEGSDHDDTFLLPVDVDLGDLDDDASDDASVSRSVNGGDGTDTVSFRDVELGAGMSLVIEANEGAVTLMLQYPHSDDSMPDLMSKIDATITDATITGIEIVEGTESGDTISVHVDDTSGVTLRGLGGDDTLTSEDGPDVLDGGAGDDTLNSMQGDTTLIGGDGNDTLNGGDDDDDLRGDAGIDTLDGNAGNDMLSGGAGGDTLDGGAGNDMLTGGAGNDDLTGGGGTDTFIFASGHGDDFITDFDDADDTIDLSAFRSAIEAWYLDEFDVELDLAGGVSNEEFAALTGENNIIRERGNSVVIDLIAFGGGTITLETTTLDLTSADPAADDQLNAANLNFADPMMA